MEQPTNSHLASNVNHGVYVQCQTCTLISLKVELLCHFMIGWSHCLSRYILRLDWLEHGAFTPTHSVLLRYVLYRPIALVLFL